MDHHRCHQRGQPSHRITVITTLAAAWVAAGRPAVPVEEEAPVVEEHSGVHDEQSCKWRLVDAEPETLTSSMQMTSAMLINEAAARRWLKAADTPALAPLIDLAGSPERSQRRDGFGEPPAVVASDPDRQQPAPVRLTGSGVVAPDVLGGSSFRRLIGTFAKNLETMLEGKERGRNPRDRARNEQRGGGQHHRDVGQGLAAGRIHGRVHLPHERSGRCELG